MLNFMKAFQRVISMKLDLFAMIAMLDETWANEDENLVRNTSKGYSFSPAGYQPWRSWRAEPFRGLHLENWGLHIGVPMLK